MLRSSILRATAAKSPVPPAHYRAISSFLQDGFDTGAFLKDGPPKEGADGAPQAKSPLDALTDPSQMDSMMDGMKKQMVMMVPQMVIMGWINFFFQGFVLSACSRQRPPPPRTGVLTGRGAQSSSRSR